jgi:hypothetical protein
MTIAVMTKETFTSLLMTFNRWCVWLLYGIWYYKSLFIKKADRKMTLVYPAFVRVQCGCDTLTTVSSLSHQYTWGSRSPGEVLLRFIRIRVHWLFLESGQHSQQRCLVLYLQKEIIRQEPTWGSLSTTSPNIHKWRAITWGNFTSCRWGSTGAIMVWLQSVHLNGHWWTSQLLI